VLRKAFAEAYKCAFQYRASSRYEGAFLALQDAEKASKMLFETNPGNIDDANSYAMALNMRGDLLLSTAANDRKSDSVDAVGPQKRS
jgi:hypothetical protein